MGKSLYIEFRESVKGYGLIILRKKIVDLIEHLIENISKGSGGVGWYNGVG